MRGRKGREEEGGVRGRRRRERKGEEESKDRKSGA